MTKRAAGQFERRRADAYDSPALAMLPLLPHLKPHTRYIEPCGGRGCLVQSLAKAGHVLVHGSDLPVDARTHRYDVRGVALAITNPPWSRPILHAIIVNLSDQLPAWLLVDSDWLFTLQAVPYLNRLRHVVVIGRRRWIEGTDTDGFDNCCWCLFDRPQPEAAIRFTGRLPKADLVAPGLVRARAAA
jgi:hypothetical protein